MTISQRSVWVQLVVMPVVAIVYFTVVLTRLADSPVEEVSWIVPMIWSMGTVVVGIIVLTIVAAIAAAIKSKAMGEDLDLEDGDIRDKEIEKIGNLKGQFFTGIGTLSVIILAMLAVDHFWIANAMFLSGLLSGVHGGLAKLRAYREGF